MFKTGLVAANANINFIFAALYCFFDKIRISEHWPCERDDIGVTIGEDFFSDVRRINAV